MINILFPTDFSANARKAVTMLVEMFHEYPLNLYLYHAYGAPKSGGSMLISIDDILLKEAKVHMADEVKRLKSIGGSKLKLRDKLVNGQLMHFVDEIVKMNNIDLIVMGTKGASGVQGVLFGSQTVNMMRKADVPVLAIPLNADASFLEKYKVVMATDQKPFHSVGQLNKVLGHMKKSGGPDKLQIVYVTAEPEDEKEEIKYFFERNIPDIPIRFFNIIDTSVTAALQDFVSKNRPDIFVLVQRKMSFFSRLFGESVTQKITLNSPVPLLVLPG